MNCTNLLKQGYSICPKRVLVVSPVKLYIINTKIKTSERMSHSLTFGTGIGFGFGLNNYNGCFSYFPSRKWQLISPYNCKRFYVSSSSFFDAFSAPIPSSYIRDTDKAFLLILRLRDLDYFDTFASKIESFLPINVSYMAFLKVRYRGDNFFMSGHNFPFVYKDNDKDNDKLISLFEIVNKRLCDSFADYKLKHAEIVYVQIGFRKLDVKLLTEFKLDKASIKDIVTRKEVESISTTSNVPVSLNEGSLGYPLKVDVSDNLITYIYITIKNETSNFLENIRYQAKFLSANHKDKIIEFDSSFKFYLLFINTKYYVLAVKYIENNKILKITYFLNGVVDRIITDTLLPDNIVSRVHGNTEFLIENNNAVYSKHFMALKPLPTGKIVHIAGENFNIGVIDLETFKEDDGQIKVYALEFKTNLVKEPVMYYLENGVTSKELIIKLINELFRSVYSNTTFYCHNFARYDLVSILNTLLDYNEMCDQGLIEDTKYKLSYIPRDQNLLKLTISKEIITTSNDKVPKIIGTRRATLAIHDSLALLNDNLENLGKNFGVKTQKGAFPYKFAIRSNLFYIGNTPHKSYYKPDIKQSVYDELINSNWSFKLETEKYLASDLNCLHEVITKANKQVFLDYKVNMIDHLTISSLALKIFMRSYYNNNIPLVNKSSMYRDIKEAYYGAITEVYRPYGEKLYYYDVNYLYPYVALQDLPGSECYKENFMNLDKSVEDLFGFYYCSVESPKDSYLGLLPVRTKGGLHFPLGKWEGWYFSEQLKFAKLNGYTIKVLKGYSFNRSKDVFKNFVSDIYKIKSFPKDDTQKQTAKSILNNLLGRFGIRLEKSVTKVLTSKNFHILSHTRAIISYKLLGNDRYLVTYLPRLDIDIITELNLDIVKIASKEKDEEKQTLEVAFIPISAAVTAYGRIHISKLKIKVMEMGGNIYYSDTDSLVTDIILPKNMVNSKELGLLKLEHTIVKGIFNNNKTYWLLVWDDLGELKVINKTLGYSYSSLTFYEHLDLLTNIDVSAKKKRSKIEWSKGYVTIEDDVAVLVKANSYKGRSKLYDNLSYWVNTKPLSMEEINRTYELKPVRKKKW